MKIDGKKLAEDIFIHLQQQIEDLKKGNIVPHVAIIVIGQDPASISYVRQKEKKAEAIGARVTIFRFQETISQEELLEKITLLNNDAGIHGIIVQRPLPKHIDSNTVNQITNPKKDIDAFHSDTPFAMPLAAAVINILKYIYTINRKHTKSDFLDWLKKKNIVVIGKGETGGGPVIAKLQSVRIIPSIIDSKTKDPETFTKNADIIISTVGKQNILQSHTLKPGVILIGVGMQRGSDGKLHGDYEEEQIKNIASFYTPIPGGVGPVNVAMLLLNLVKAAEMALQAQTS